MSDNMHGAEVARNTARRESDPHPVVEMLLATVYEHDSTWEKDVGADRSDERSAQTPAVLGQQMS